MSTFFEIMILSVAAASVENLDERTRGGIRSVSMFAGIAKGTPSGGARETDVSGGVTLRLTLNFRFPTEKDPPSGDCNTKRLLLEPEYMPETVKTLCQSSRSFVKRCLTRSQGHAQVHTLQTSVERGSFANAREIDPRRFQGAPRGPTRKRAINSQAAREAAR
jgi:hypothetical protein